MRKACFEVHFGKESCFVHFVEESFCLLVLLVEESLSV